MKNTITPRLGRGWAGIQEIRTTNGTPVTNYTLSSASSFDFGAGVSPAPPQISQVSPAPGGLALVWADSFSRSHTVESVPALQQTNWMPVPGMTWPITTNRATLTVQPGTNAFFRVRAE